MTDFEPDFDEEEGGDPLTDLLLEASAFPYERQLQRLVERCFATVLACEPCGGMRAAFVSLHRWAALCATVTGATDAQLARLINLIEFEIENPDGPDSATVQNWYLTKANGKVDPLRAAVIAAVPKRTTRPEGLSGARTLKPKRRPAWRESSGPGSSPRGGGGQCIPFPIPHGGKS
jgi:hypothetical protein